MSTPPGVDDDNIHNPLKGWLDLPEIRQCAGLLKMLSIGFEKVEHVLHFK